MNQKTDWYSLCLQLVLVALIKLMNQESDYYLSFDIAAVKENVVQSLLLVHVLSKYSLFQNFTLLL